MAKPKKSPPLGYEKVIAALRAHSSKRMTGNEEDIYLAAVALRRETDRGAIILATTAFEDQLEQALLAVFRPLNSAEKTELFGFEAPLRSFSAKIRLAYALGILDKSKKRVADTVRIMRNTCAHAGQATSFGDKALMQALYFMLQEYGYHGDELGLRMWSDDRPDLPRMLFLSLISDLTVIVAEQTGLPKPDYANLFSAYLAIGVMEEQEDNEGRCQEFRIRSTRWDPDD